jgi:hypothetical protein
MPHTSRLGDLEDDYVLSCNLSGVGSRDVVYRLTLAAASDVDITVTSPTTGTVYGSLRSTTCATNAGERLCRAAPATAAEPLLHQRTLPAGTYWVLIEHSANADVTVTARITTPPAPRNAGDACPIGATDAVELNDGLPHTLSLSAMEDDFRLSCNSTTGLEVRDVVYRLTLAAPADVNFTLTTSLSSWTFVSLRDSPCEGPATERLCRSAFSTAFPLLRQASLPAGTYWLVVENGSNPDVTVTATITTPPVPRAAGDICPTGTVAAVELNDGLPHTLSLSAMEDDFRLSCNATTTVETRDVVYRLTLAAAADVDFTVTSSLPALFFVSLRDSPCETPATERFCRTAVTSSSLPHSTSTDQRSLPAGTYWLVVESTNPVDITVTAAITSPP